MVVPSEDQLLLHGPTSTNQQALYIPHEVRASQLAQA